MIHPIEHAKTKDPLIIMGNGPSLRNINIDKLRDYDTFGINNAYSIYSKINFWPKYFLISDGSFLNEQRKKEVCELDKTPIEFLFLPFEHSNKNKIITISNDIRKPEEMYDTYKGKSLIHRIKHTGGSSIVTACKIGVCLEYTKIILLGIDYDYTKDDSEKIDIKSFKCMGCPDCLDDKDCDIKEYSNVTDANKNYWFDSYLRNGDATLLDKSTSLKFHEYFFGILMGCAKKMNVDIVNCNPNSNIKSFRTSTLEKEL